MNNRFLIEPRVIANIIKLSKIKKSDVVMDYPCSTGYSSAILSMLSKKVYGVDNKGKLLDEASSNIKKLNIKNVKFIEKNPLDVIDKRIDIIFIFGGVELVPINLINCLKNNGGTLVTVLYKKNNIATVVKHIPGHGMSKCDSHYKTPVIKTNKKDLIKKDFKPEIIIGFNGWNEIASSQIFKKMLLTKWGFFI